MKQKNKTTSFSVLEPVFFLPPRPPDVHGREKQIQKTENENFICDLTGPTML